MSTRFVVAGALCFGLTATLVLLLTAIHAYPTGEATITFNQAHEYHFELFLLIPLMVLSHVVALRAVLKQPKELKS